MIGNQFQFKNRESARMQFFENLVGDYKVWLESHPTQTEPLKRIHFQVAVGAGGIGKTTFATRVFLQEYQNPQHPSKDLLGPLLESLLCSPYGHLIFQSSFSSFPLRPFERDEKYIESSLATRILYSFLQNISAGTNPESIHPSIYLFIMMPSLTHFLPSFF